MSASALRQQSNGYGQGAMSSSPDAVVVPPVDAADGTGQSDQPDPFESYEAERPRRDGRPWLIANMVAGLDGSLAWRRSGRRPVQRRRPVAVRAPAGLGRRRAGRRGHGAGRGLRAGHADRGRVASSAGRPGRPPVPPVVVVTRIARARLGRAALGGSTDGPADRGDRGVGRRPTRSSRPGGGPT